MLKTMWIEERKNGYLNSTDWKADLLSRVTIGDSAWERGRVGEGGAAGYRGGTLAVKKCYTYYRSNFARAQVDKRERSALLS